MEKPEALERGQRWSLMGTEQVIKELDSQGRYISPTSGFTWSREEFNSSSWSFLGWAPGYGPTTPPLSTPVPAKWEVGQRRRGTLSGDKVYEYTVVERRNENNVWGNANGSWWVEGDDIPRRFTALESWPSELISPAPGSTSTRATGAEATVWEHSSNGLFWRECQKTSDVCGHQYTRRKGEAGASAATTRVVPQMGRLVKGDGTVLPAGCLACGGDKDQGAYLCWKCLDKRSDFWPLREAWDAGARDFPRKPQTDSVAPQKTASSATWQNTNVPASAFQILQARERDRAARRAADAAVLATFVDFVDLLPDVSP